MGSSGEIDMLTFSAGRAPEAGAEKVREASEAIARLVRS